MKQAGACPDAVECLRPIDILKAQDRNREAGMLYRKCRQLRGCIECGHAVATVEKVACIPSGAATGIKDMSAGEDQR